MISVSLLNLLFVFFFPRYYFPDFVELFICVLFFFCQKNYFLMFIFERKTWHEWGEGQRERETQNLKQAPGSELSAQSPMWGSNPPTVRSWPKPKSRVRCLTDWATQAPLQISLFFFFNVFYLFLGQRETEHERGRGSERGRHRIGNRLQAPSHQPRAWRGARTHGPRGRDLAEVGRLTDCATQAPPKFPFNKDLSHIGGSGPSTMTSF